jgi:CubicO group peptidase (beta-lactamase class C family)
MQRKHIPFCVLLLWLAPTFVVAQSDRTDEFIRAEMQRQNIPGLSLVVLEHGEVVKAAGYGFANLKEKIPATPETV